eukprot:6596752-Prymnesium_polylepis.1
MQSPAPSAGGAGDSGPAAARAVQATTVARAAPTAAPLASTAPTPRPDIRRPTSTSSCLPQPAPPADRSCRSSVRRRSPGS